MFKRRLSERWPNGTKVSSSDTGALHLLVFTLFLRAKSVCSHAIRGGPMFFAAPCMTVRRTSAGHADSAVFLRVICRSCTFGIPATELPPKPQDWQASRRHAAEDCLSAALTATGRPPPAACHPRHGLAVLVPGAAPAHGTFRRAQPVFIEPCCK